MRVESLMHSPLAHGFFTFCPHATLGSSLLTALLSPTLRRLTPFCLVFFVQFVMDNMTTRKWDDRFDTLHYLRQILKFSPESLEPHL